MLHHHLINKTSLIFQLRLLKLAEQIVAKANNYAYLTQINTNTLEILNWRRSIPVKHKICTNNALNQLFSLRLFE